MWIYVNNYEVQKISQRTSLIADGFSKSLDINRPILFTADAWNMQVRTDFINWYVCKREREREREREKGRERERTWQVYLLCVFVQLLVICGTVVVQRGTIGVQKWEKPEYNQYRYIHIYIYIYIFIYSRGTVGTDTALLSSPKC